MSVPAVASARLRRVRRPQSGAAVFLNCLGGRSPSFCFKLPPPSERVIPVLEGRTYRFVLCGAARGVLDVSFLSGLGIAQNKRGTRQASFAGSSCLMISALIITRLHLNIALLPWAIRKYSKHITPTLSIPKVFFLIPHPPLSSCFPSPLVPWTRSIFLALCTQVPVHPRATHVFKKSHLSC